MMNTQTCHHCGAPLPPDAPPGICPSCVLRAALDVAAEDPAEDIDGSLSEFLPGFVEAGAGAPALSLSRRFGDYELLEEIARGGMGIVCRARQISLDRIVAVKLLPFSSLATPKYIKRFRAEASAAAALRHPNIVTVHEVGVQQGQHYLVMNFVNGPPLGRLVAGGPLPARRAATYMKVIAEAVHYAHEHGILHRDLKPSNVLIDENDQPQITDFGLAKRLDGESSLTLTGQALGSPGYMPPEQALAEHSKVTRRSDVYGLGAMLYHLLTGRPPFMATTLHQAIRQVADKDPILPQWLNPGIPRDLQTICLKCLEKEPALRYANAQEVAEDLERYLNGDPVRAHPIGAYGKTLRWCRRRPFLAGLSLALVLSVAAGLSGVLWQWRRAVANEWLAHQNAYAADMNHVHESLEEGDFGTALSLLNKYRSEPDSSIALGARSSSELRNWEWRYLWSLCQSDEQSTLCRYPVWVGGVVVSVDGNLLAVQKGDGDVVLWDLRDGREIMNLPASGNRGTIAFSPTGNLLAAANQVADGQAEVRLWDLRSLDNRVSLPHEAPVMSLAFSPDGKFLATQDNREAVRVWEIESKQVLTNLVAGGGAGWPSQRWSSGGVLRFSPDGTLLAFQSRFSSIRVMNWRAGTNTLVISPPPPDRTDNPMVEQLTTLAFSPNGELLAWGVGQGTIRLWDMVQGQFAGELTGHRDSILGLVFAADGRRLASASGDQTIRVWNVADHREVVCLRGNEQEVWGLDFLPDGRTLVSGGKDGSVRFWNLNPSGIARVHSALPIILPAFTRDGQQFIGLEGGNGSLSLWDARSLQRMETLSEWGTNNYCFGLSSNEKWLAVARRDEDSVRIWDWPTRTQVTNLDLPVRPRGVGFKPGDQVLFAEYDLPRPARTVGPASAWKNWKTDSWEEVKRHPVDKLKPNVCLGRFSPDGRLIAVGYESGEIELRIVAEGRVISTLAGYPSRVQDIRFSADGRRLAAASWDDFVKVWDVPSREELMTLRGHFTHTVSVAFSPDGQRLAVGGVGGGVSDPRVKIWDLATRRELLTLAGAAWDLQFSPDGAMITAREMGSKVWQTRFWRAPSWEEIEATEMDPNLR
jgi:WD40 repeat protein/serine/threonine protein kinase